MKKFFSNKWVCIALIFVVFVIIFFASGFKIVYAPWLLNDWEAIGACASWVAAITSGVAIYVAILIPKKIANEQNKIALFEKRYKFYQDLQHYKVFCQQIDNDYNNHFRLCTWFAAAFDDTMELSSFRNNRDEYVNRVILLQYKKKAEIERGTYLFREDMIKKIVRMTTCLSILLESKDDLEKRGEYYVKFKHSIDEIEKDIIPLVEKEIKLK